jgi:hypothetical protein
MATAAEKAAAKGAAVQPVAEAGASEVAPEPETAAKGAPLSSSTAITKVIRLVIYSDSLIQ